MKLRTRIFVILLVVLCLSSSVIPAFAHKSYYLSTSIDKGSRTYVAVVQTNPKANTSGINHEAEINCDVIFSMSTGWNLNILADYIALLNSDSEVSRSEWEDFYTDKFNMDEWDDTDIPDNACFAFTFPAFHGDFEDWTMGRAVDGGGDDKALAERAAGMVTTLNEAIQFVMPRCFGTNSAQDIDDLKVLGAQLAVYAQAPGTYTIGTKQVTFAAGKDAWHVKITVDGETNEYQYRVPKGYKSSVDGIKDEDYVEHKEKYRKKLFSGSDAQDVTYISWDLIVLQANYLADTKGIDFGSLEELYAPGPFAQLLGELLEWMVGTITATLQLKSYEDFFLMRNNIATTWIYGIFPAGWLAPAMLLYAISLTIAMSLIGFSILKILWKKQLSTVNIGEKIAMQESIKNLIVTMFLFFAFIPIFIFLAGLNASLVKLFATATSGVGTSTLLSISYSNFASIMLGIADLILIIYFNFFYVARGITVAVLIGIAPLAIYTLSLGGKTSGVFTAFMKELISQIFVQTVHAMIAAFFFNISAVSSLTSFEKIVVLYSFIPITKFVKTKVFQLAEGPAGQVAATGAGLAAGVMSGAANAAGDALKSKGKAGAGANGQGGSGGGFGGEGGESALSGVMDRTAGQQRSAAAKTGTPPKMADSKDTSATPSGYSNVYSSKNGGAKPWSSDARASAGQGFKDAGGNIKNDFKDGVGHGIYNLPKNIGDMGRAAGDAMFGTGMRGEENRRLAGGLAKAAGSMGVGALYGGLALGMGAIGENPTKYAEGYAKHTINGQRMGHAALHDKYDQSKSGGLRDQQIAAMESAGIHNISTNGSYTRFDIDRGGQGVSEQHKSIYDDLSVAYGTSGNYSAEQREAARNYYRDNYGIHNVTLQPDANNNNSMQIDMETAKMQAHRISEMDPFEQMKAFKWRTEKDK